VPLPDLPATTVGLPGLLIFRRNLRILQIIIQGGILRLHPPVVLRRILILPSYPPISTENIAIETVTAIETVNATNSPIILTPEDPPISTTPKRTDAQTTRPTSENGISRKKTKIRKEKKEIKKKTEKEIKRKTTEKRNEKEKEKEKRKRKRKEKRKEKEKEKERKKGKGKEKEISTGTNDRNGTDIAKKI
jgi:outer membrane biosynthesis protein TonB